VTGPTSESSSGLPRVLVILPGDPHKGPGTRTKYGLLLDALAEQLPLFGVWNGDLWGSDRLRNALLSFHPDRRRWRERFYKNPGAFRRRSQRLADRLQAQAGSVDVVLQIGALFDSACAPSDHAAGRPPLPVVIYTDYTAALSARKPEAGRSPLGPAEQRRWLALELLAYRRAAHICVRSRLAARSLIEDFAVSPDKVTVVGGGVNFDPLPEWPLPPASGAPGRQPNAPVALFIGKDFRRKGGPLLLEAFALARRTCPSARLLLVTSEPPQPLPTGVEWVAPTWDREVIAALYRRADLFVLPSRLETWGDVLLEAMAFGLPCVGVDDDAMGEIILPDHTGMLVPACDPTALSEALIRLFQDGELRRRLGTAGRERAAHHFLWPQVTARIATCLSAVWRAEYDPRQESRRPLESMPHFGD
jgi:glycosyltransferase involved in cell wall biosynthesis